MIGRLDLSQFERAPIVLANGLRFPEGPAFDGQNRLWAVELKGGALLRMNDGVVERIAVGGAPNGLAFWDDQAWFCDADQRSIRRLNEDGICETIVDAVDGVAPDRPNDLAFDAAGNLVFTCPGNSRTEPTGSVWCRRPDGSLRAIAQGMYFPNGLAFSADGKTLVIAETYRHRLWRGVWNAETTQWIGATPWAEVGGPIGPDGMAFCETGALFVALYGLGAVAVVEGDTPLIRRIAVDGQCPTNLAFDPAGTLGLVITEADQGRLLQYRTDVRGAPLFRTKPTSQPGG
ncbi:MAG: hypothetical protein B7Y49_01130 [Sphingomonas sp. 28-62-11]|nr:MAG: hypothetical protein B7Y49_01130 [Sphingomonas sp. 28-62-11]